MHLNLLNYICCPLCQENLQVGQVASPGDTLPRIQQDNIDYAYLLCPACTMVYPVIEGVPRMLLESFLDHEGYLEKAMTGFRQLKIVLLERFGEKIQQAAKRNRRSRQSFTREWKLLEKDNSLKVWNADQQEFESQLFRELGIVPEALKGKKIVDIGCGHGRSSKILAKSGELVIGMDLGQSVLNAAKTNKMDNCHFIQGDLHHPPFKNGFFDIVYSSGVIHHTPDTYAAFKSIAQLTSSGGRLCIWIYQPYDNWIHKLMLTARNLTIHIPAGIQFWTYFFSLLPIHKVVGALRGKQRHWREIMIEQMDMLSPEFRHEHEPEEAKEWFLKHNFSHIAITSSDKWGFSMVGINYKPSSEAATCR
ncbi:methyltransferase domain-containing protein [Flavihumibacter rivuli]|uniref:methyltransferase domain-containing protein n=1 Tax=Flavihumibacter rivuli TaxID=2838156 RepID=UPI001BDE0519|nr:methyltransferase domain-containing protein [Flavihumibacter rivuli]ULQ57542.1 methyltransferase domain-containing protein [Flavihumibacter rivuli]